MKRADSHVGRFRNTDSVELRDVLEAPGRLGVVGPATRHAVAHLALPPNGDSELPLLGRSVASCQRSPSYHDHWPRSPLLMPNTGTVKL